MVDLGLALTWIAISAAGAKGLSVFARAVAADNGEAELVCLATDHRAEHRGMGQIDELLPPPHNHP